MVPPTRVIGVALNVLAEDPLNCVVVLPLIVFTLDVKSDVVL